MKLTVWRPPHRIGQTQCKHVRWNFRRRNNDIRCPLGIDLCIERNGWQWWWPMLIMFNIQWKQMKNKKTENELLWYYSRHKLGFGGGADMWGVCTEWVPVCPGSHDGCNSGVGGDNKTTNQTKPTQKVECRDNAPIHLIYWLYQAIVRLVLRQNNSYWYPIHAKANRTYLDSLAT